MTILLNIVFPIFAIILAGFLCGRFRLLDDRSSEGLNKFVYWVALPALLFRAMSNVELEQVFDADFLGVYVGAQALTMLGAMLLGMLLFRNTLAEAGINGMNAIYGNTGFLGIPLALAAFGEAATVPTIITVVVNSAVVVAAATLVVEFSLQKGSASHGKVVWGVLKALLKNPMIIAPVLGIFWAMQPEPLPASIDKFCELLGYAAGPCTLFAIGLFLVGKPISSGFKEVSVITGIKLVIQPLLTWWLAMAVFNLSPLWTAVAVLMAATPTGAGSFVLALQYQLHVQRTSTIILLSTVISVATIFLLLQQYQALLVP